ncbi:MAG: hypothetical protein AABW63_03300 [Nanoarchaeota archaeon]
MAKEDIIGGIRIALSKGQKLEDVMQSFYNASYKKEDIEQAVSELFSETSQSQQQTQLPLPLQKINFPPSQPTIPPTPQKIISQTLPQQQTYQKPINTSPTLQTQKEPDRDTRSLPTLEEIQKRYQPLTPAVSMPKQIVSDYSKKNKTDPVTVILIVVLALLLGVLFAIFIFRKQIVEFLNKLL